MHQFILILLLKIFNDSYVDGSVGGKLLTETGFSIGERSISKRVEFALSVPPPANQKKVPKNVVEWMQYVIHLTTDGNIKHHIFKNTLESEVNVSRLSRNRNLNTSYFQLLDEIELDSVSLNHMIIATEKWLNFASTSAYSRLSHEIYQF